MHLCYRLWLAAALLYTIGASSCSHATIQADQRLMVLPFESESKDLDWASWTAPAVLNYDLTGLPYWYVMTAESIRLAPGSRATRVLEGYITREGQRLTVHATLEDPQSRKTVKQFMLEGPASGGIVPLLDQLAENLQSGAHNFPTRDGSALRSYGEALLLKDPAARARLLETATVADPKFSVAYLVLAETLLSQGDRARAAEVAANGARATSNLVDRTQLEFLAATARGDARGRERALTGLVALTPSNPQALRNLAEVHTIERRYADAIRDYEALARLEPENPVTYNQLGYLHAYQHDLGGARVAFHKYQELSPPGDVNPIDSLGEGYYFNGDFAAAERSFLEAYQKNPQALGGREMLKAAEARMMTGDVPGADGLFQKYMGLQRGSEQKALEIELAQWEFLTGRRKQGMARLEKLIPDGGDAASLAGTQLAFWHLQTGDRAGAMQLAAEARGRVVSASMKSANALCRFLLESPAPTSPYPTLNAMALMLNRRFAEAIPLLEGVMRESQPAADEQARVLLAWAYVETGKFAEARPLVDLYPIPLPSREPLFTSMIFPRFLKTRAAVLEAEQKADEARRTQQLFEKLTGDLPDRF